MYASRSGAAGLKRHVKIHGKNVVEPLARAVHVCRASAKECKSLAGLKLPHLGCSSMNCFFVN